MKIVILDALTLGKDIDLDIFNKFGDVTIYQSTNKEDTLSRVKNQDIVITNKVVIDKDIMQNSSIKLICITATGMNNVDLDYAKQSNIEVKNVAGYSTYSVAQVTISYALNFIQKLDYYKAYTKNRLWEKSEIFTNIDVPFNELNNKKWGIIGLGEIGKTVANIASAFGCDVQYYSTSGKNSNSSYNNVNLETLLSTSDIISIHCPLNKDTLNLLDKRNLDLIKDKAILINVGRGGIINEQDLVESFKRKNFYCALDVVDEEPIKSDSVLNEIVDNDRIIITPHIAWSSIEARNTLINMVASNIDDFLN